ncbi:MAG: ribosome small subunit-dependent GTPase A [Deltaproteobacteria bacterium]|nr:ribosome small subunit-dependent GTPase A [Deltaproteobacteria bacterium]
MSGQNLNILESLGFDLEMTGFMQDRPNIIIGRIVRHDRISLLALTELGEFIVEVPGRMRRKSTNIETPCIGDWVTLAPTIQPQRVTLDSVLPRRTKLVRQRAGEISGEQILAANIDTLFIVSGLDNDFNPRRIERYLTLAWQSGSRPVIVLNKIDVCPNPAQRISETLAIALNVPAIAISARTKQGIDGIRPFLGFGKTGALIGSSGVGKSSIVNTLLNEQRFAIGAVRLQDQRGRHITARRELVVLPEGAGCLIDTPGLREVQLCGDENGLNQAFADIATLAKQCRFTNCTHGIEPHCKVREAIDNGKLSLARFDNYQTLQNELQRLQTRWRTSKQLSKGANKYKKRK